MSVAVEVVICTRADSVVESSLVVVFVAGFFFELGTPLTCGEVLDELGIVYFVVIRVYKKEQKPNELLASALFPYSVVIRGDYSIWTRLKK